jgi:hypothetical protein
MKIRNLAIAAGVLALGSAAWLTPGKAQGPLYDRIQVTLPYTVTIGERTLQPGDYIIQQLRDNGSSRILLIYSDSGMKFETSAMTIPALDINTARDTKVVLHHFGPDYYFDKIWIQGKDYGYEFPLPNSVKSRERERMEPVSVAANYQATPTTEATTSTSTAQATSAAANEQTSTAAASQQTSTAAASQQTSTAAASQQTSTAAQSETTSQATTHPQTMAQATTQPQTTPPATMAQTTEPSANREAPATMPHTSAGWLGMLLAGGTLSGIGLKLRRIL